MFGFFLFPFLCEKSERWLHGGWSGHVFAKETFYSSCLLLSVDVFVLADAIKMTSQRLHVSQHLFVFTLRAAATRRPGSSIVA